MSEPIQKDGLTFELNSVCDLNGCDEDASRLFLAHSVYHEGEFAVFCETHSHEFPIESMSFSEVRSDE